jgi:Uma2 family endonuclease
MMVLSRRHSDIVGFRTIEALMSTVSPPIRTFADLLQRLGDVPLDRLRFRPFPATVADVVAIQEREGRLCELVEGVLLEKTVGYRESRLAIVLASLLDEFVLPRNLGIVTGSDGMVELFAELVRIPDVAFTSWDRLPGGAFPSDAVPEIVPDLVVEVLGPSNSAGEMSAKRGDYFSAGVRLVWEVDPRQRTVTVYESPDSSRVLAEADDLDGGSVLPGFAISLRELFADLDRCQP